MVQTRVGYAGGRELEPTYRDIGGHAEAIRIAFDPSLTSFDTLFEHFAANGRSLGGAGQYRGAVFLQDEEQARTVEDFVRRNGLSRAERRGVVEVGRPEGRFWDAEDYHQKYRLRRRQGFVAQLVADLGRGWDRYPVATYLNGVVGTRQDPGRWLSLLPSSSHTAWARTG